ncbi:MULTISPECIES: potassium-transporting ATPase subunit C [Streptomyces]|uniref:Potassium-transporting ATPase KdpC subunit n=1 Tax=Streptomyces tendae TaxID=1932 RepID=A0A6B3QLY5_STRTE|nr:MULTISPECIES: potassium-transporting ATPase subunit C [Streptomyces]MCW1095363.1 potassium-transporting ATPase subunit C [Streptomyces sp. RS2]NEV88972.1 potassium-transporting ATPase subunit C [Streptomyces tendae]BET48780.1 potassium-transporting ATPase subunit C [Kitasatospora aureofaciens]
MNTSVSNAARLLAAGLRALLVLTVVTGILYPLAVTGVAQGLFPGKANGSQVEADGRVVGSSLIGQAYNLPLGKGQETPEPDLKWFQGRPQNGLGSNSVNTQYKLILSGATNRSADNPELLQWVKDAKAAVVKDNSVPGHPVRPEDVPADAVTSSGSGLDPDISPQYAGLQVHRVAEKNGLPADRVRKLVDEHTTARTLGFIGEPRVNVLELNIALKDLVAPAAGH